VLLILQKSFCEQLLNFDKNRTKFSLRKIDGEKPNICFRDKTHLYNSASGRSNQNLKETPAVRTCWLSSEIDGDQARFKAGLSLYPKPNPI